MIFKKYFRFFKLFDQSLTIFCPGMVILIKNNNNIEYEIENVMEYNVFYFAVDNIKKIVLIEMYYNLIILFKCVIIDLQM